MVIMVIRLPRFPASRFAIARQVTDFDFGFTVDGQSQNTRSLVGSLIRLGDMGKNGVSFGQLLLRLYFLRFLRR